MSLFILGIHFLHFRFSVLVIFFWSFVLLLLFVIWFLFILFHSFSFSYFSTSN